MGKQLIAGNWKLNLTVTEAAALAQALATESEELLHRCDLLVAPGFLALETVRSAVLGTAIQVAAQNAYHEPKGAFTGEVSFAQLRDLGVYWVILGHSERRSVFGEHDELLARKLKGALDCGMLPIFCVGESLEQRESGAASTVVKAQLQAALSDLPSDVAARLVIAYEPVWAIGTGLTASPAQAAEMHALIREELATLWGEASGKSVRLLYGGSVKAANAAELLGQPNVDGVLVGGASLQASEFLAIAAASCETR